MGQQLFKVDFEKNDVTETNDTMRSRSADEQIGFIFPWKIDRLLKTSVDTTNDDRLLNAENTLIKQIRSAIFLLTNSKGATEIDIQIDQILIDDVCSFVENIYEKAMKETTEAWEEQQKLRTSLSKKLKEEVDENRSIFPANENLSTSENVHNNQKLSYFALQSLASVLLILIKSAEKTDPAIVQQILSLASQLIEQVPIRYLSSSDYSNFLFQSLKPLRSYFEDLSLSSDVNFAGQATKILLHFSIARASFKELLPLLARLIFETNSHYDVRNLIDKLNNALSETASEEKEQNTGKNSF